MSTSYSNGRPTAQLPSGLRGNSPLGLMEPVKVLEQLLDQLRPGDTLVA